jgi:hypothetical protein
MSSLNCKTIGVKDNSIEEQNVRATSQLVTSSLATESSCTDVPGLAVLRAQCMSDSSLDITTEGKVKIMHPVPAAETVAMDRVAFRRHPCMKPPPFVRLLRIETSEEALGMLFYLADLPRFPRVGLPYKPREPSWRRRESMFSGAFTVRVTDKGNLQSPRPMQKRRFHGWGLCSCYDTAAVVVPAD